ncbi:putative E3 ubiquitin-protein ligase synoviolin [Rosellinia necatrix]|uniref:RING-type E3 ubiquitin transferase n=1 Tax=Rosellinia necatrix TaxID=77044 RepID=A0A1W2THJ6_ROSNE|nr:putative E3 ubiquitin-protein ligase synoviolin [Rosellinia necatrix]
MRLLWYAGASTALATGVVAYAFNQRANFYSAMVYLSQNNLSLMILVNLVLLLYASFVWGLQRLCYGPLRPVEIEQLYEKAWFAVTETCLAMTIFREEVGAWFLVMFTALVTGKVWEWIGEGRVEVLEQQPPANPRLFHTRLSISLFISVAYDTWLFWYAVHAVIQQARPNMMVMFLFEFAILAACSSRTASRYLLSLIEGKIVKNQTRTRLEERRRLAREQRNDILRRRESDDTAEAEAARQEELPDEEDIDEMDIEVPGWESKGHWILTLDLFTDFIKLFIYSVFFAILMMFYGLPIHIMRDLFLTARSFLKRLGALMRYRKALQDMNKYPDATQEDLAREDTCIICREEMRPWDPSAVGTVERSRPKKLPCGHILHFGCLKGWLERQQVCPTCRRSVVIDGAVPDGIPVAPGPNGAGQAPPPFAPPPGLGAGAGNPGQPGHPRGNLRVFQFGPIRLGFAQGNAQNIHDLANQLRMPLDAANQPAAPAVIPTPTPPVPPANSNNTQNSIEGIQVQLQDISNRIQQEMDTLRTTQAELQTLYALTVELNRLRQGQLPTGNGLGIQSGHTTAGAQFVGQQLPHHVPNSTLYIPPSSVTRHGGSPYASAIPSGSQDLPPGVSIPPGWSLLPLQRLDGQTAHQQMGTQSAPMVPSHDLSHQQYQTAQLSRHNLPRDLSGTVRSSTPAADTHNTARYTDARGGHDRNPEPSSSQPQREPPNVAAPTPVVPQWGGSLFGNRASSSAASHTINPISTNEGIAENGTHATESSDGDDESDASSGKGKAKAVTIEDAEEDGSD